MGQGCKSGLSQGNPKICWRGPPVNEFRRRVPVLRRPQNSSLTLPVQPLQALKSHQAPIFPQWFFGPIRWPPCVGPHAGDSPFEYLILDSDFWHPERRFVGRDRRTFGFEKSLFRGQAVGKPVLVRNRRDDMIPAKTTRNSGRLPLQRLQKASTIRRFGEVRHY